MRGIEPPVVTTGPKPRPRCSACCATSEGPDPGPARGGGGMEKRSGLARPLFPCDAGLVNRHRTGLALRFVMYFRLEADRAGNPVMTSRLTPEVSAWAALAHPVFQKLPGVPILMTFLTPFWLYQPLKRTVMPVFLGALLLIACGAARAQSADAGIRYHTQTLIVDTVKALPECLRYCLLGFEIRVRYTGVSVEIYVVPGSSTT